MDQWKFVTAAVTVFAFSLEIRPMDSFLTAYLTGPEVNATLDEVSNVLTPIRIYVGVLGSLLVFLLADYLRYKPVMLFNGLVGMLAYVCLMEPTSFRLKIAEVGLSLFTCAEVSNYGYTYAKIKRKEHYQTATAYIKAGMLSGRFVSGLLGQSVAYLNDGDYYALSYISLASVTFASVWACFLPAVEHGARFHAEEKVSCGGPAADAFSKAAIHHRDVPSYSEENDDFQNVNRTTAKTNPLKLIYEDYKQSYTDLTVLRWSVWHIIGMATYVQVFLYVNILYTYVADASADGKHALLNGAVDSLATVFAAFVSYKIGNVNVDWIRHGDMFLTLSSLALGLALCSCCYSTNVYSVYVLYIFYSTLIQSAFVIVISQIAKELKHGCYTLILGFNSFLAIVLGTCTSILLVRLGISVPVEFLIYGGIYMVLGVLYGCAVFRQKVMSTRRFRRLP